MEKLNRYSSYKHFVSKIIDFELEHSGLLKKQIQVAKRLSKIMPTKVINPLRNFTT